MQVIAGDMPKKRGRPAGSKGKSSFDKKPKKEVQDEVKRKDNFLVHKTAIAEINKLVVNEETR